jgi:hypothetical protein
MPDHVHKRLGPAYLGQAVTSADTLDTQSRAPNPGAAMSPVAPPLMKSLKQQWLQYLLAHHTVDTI